jgi:hypothetical protein
MLLLSLLLAGCVTDHGYTKTNASDVRLQRNYGELVLHVPAAAASKISRDKVQALEILLDYKTEGHFSRHRYVFQVASLEQDKYVFFPPQVDGASLDGALLYVHLNDEPQDSHGSRFFINFEKSPCGKAQPSVELPAFDRNLTPAHVTLSAEGMSGYCIALWQEPSGHA